MEQAQQAYKRYADRHRRDHNIQEGQLVLLSTRHLRLKGVSAKFAPRWIGPYPVQHVRGTAVTLKLPPELSQLHPTFHTSLIRPFHGSDTTPEPVEVEGG